MPGTRVLLDAHNSYPERGQWTDRLPRALATGTPLAIEQDLYWVPSGPGGRWQSVVAHDSDAVAGAPTLDAHFFEALQPLMEQALRENRRDEWPLVTLNLDFKTDEPAHHAYIYALLERYAAWLTTAPRTATPSEPAPLTVGPMMVLTGADSTQRRDFHDRIAIGGRLLLFGAMPSVTIPGADKAERTRNAATWPAPAMIPQRVSNYVRWVNFGWNVVEAGGQRAAGDWSATDSLRLAALVSQAHAQGLWIRFYTLDGFTAADDRGWTASYNFGTLDAARVRWRAAVQTGVDFIATDQYELFAAHRQK